MNWSPKATVDVGVRPPGGLPMGSTSPSNTGSTAQRCVLIVDDENNILSSLKRLLRREDYTLLTASSGEQALKIMAEHPAQVVISDFRMPSMSGADLLREIQQGWPETIRIVLSGYSEVKAIISAINEGAIYKFISKPWNDEELRGNIRQALEQFSLAAENKRLAEELAGRNEKLRQANELLGQRASDATSGLNSAQDLLDAVAVGILAFDPSGLIVEVNRRAGELFDVPPGELIGMPAEIALPDELRRILLEHAADMPAVLCGRMEHNGLRLQWRRIPVGLPPDIRGALINFWEEVE